MYRSFFGLSELPFRSTPDLEFFYKEADREQVVGALLYSLDRGDGIIKVVGEVGSGKTTILRMLSKQLPADYSTVYINSPNLSAHDILFFICVEFGLTVEPDENKFFLTKKLQNFLLNEYSENKKPLVLIDEAQAMPIETLEEIRLLTNLETDHDKLLQIVLFGQPELDVNLALPQIRQFLSRISHSILLEPFSEHDVFLYLNFRMRKAGYQGLDIFSAKTAKSIFKQSQGLPRNIHVLADRALLSAYSSNDKLVQIKHLSDSQSNRFNIKRFSWLASLLLISVVVFLMFSFFKSNSNQKDLVVVEPAVDSFIQSEVNDDNKQIILNDLEAEINDKLAEKSDIGRELNNLLETVEKDKSIRYSIQLMTGDLASLNSVREELNENYYFERAKLVFVPLNKKNQFVVYYGYYEGYSYAEAFISQLPPNIKAGKPFVISKSQLIKQVKLSLKQNPTEPGEEA